MARYAHATTTLHPLWNPDRGILVRLHRRGRHSVILVLNHQPEEDGDMSMVKWLVALAAIGLLAGALLFEMTTSPNQEVRRFHAVTGLRPEKADYYFRLHAATWPGVLKMIEEANIRNFSIAVKEIDGKLYLLSYYEYVGNDYEADMRRIAADPETQRWWKETEPCQLPLPDAAAKGAIWADAREVFYTP